jgi:hypothetical protein
MKTIVNNFYLEQKLILFPGTRLLQRHHRKGVNSSDFA